MSSTKLLIIPLKPIPFAAFFSVISDSDNPLLLVTDSKSIGALFNLLIHTMENDAAVERNKISMYQYGVNSIMYG